MNSHTVNMLLSLLKKLWKRFSQHEISVYAAQASFFIVIAFFPFLMLLLTLIQCIPSVTRSDLMSLLVQILPDMLDALVIGILDDLYVKSPATILSITALLALWSASRGMLGIARGLNRIHGTPFRRNYLLNRLICTGYTFILILVCVVSLTLLVFGTSLQNFLLRLFPFLAAFMKYIISFRSLLAMVLLMLSFSGLYAFVPQEKQRLTEQLPGTIFAAIGWMLFSYLFSLYFTYFSNYSYMYGSLTAMVLLMLWLYFGICILFLGAEINQLLDGEE